MVVFAEFESLTENATHEGPVIISHLYLSLDSPALSFAVTVSCACVPVTCGGIAAAGTITVGGATEAMVTCAMPVAPFAEATTLCGPPASVGAVYRPLGLIAPSPTTCQLMEGCGTIGRPN